MNTSIRSTLRGVLLAISLVSASVSADAFTARVLYVHDADTADVGVLQSCSAPGCPEVGQEVRVRFFGIDAPESDQPYGDQATQRLRAVIDNQPVTIKQVDTDDNGRAVGDVFYEGEWLNGWLVSEGLAWVSPKYAVYDTLFTRHDNAKAAGKGLWEAPDPVAPWEWRQQ